LRSMPSKTSLSKFKNRFYKIKITMEVILIIAIAIFLVAIAMIDENKE